MVNMVVFSVGCRVQPDCYRARIGARRRQRNQASQQCASTGKGQMLSVQRRQPGDVMAIDSPAGMT
jgi:hypothetical protein